MLSFAAPELMMSVLLVSLLSSVKSPKKLGLFFAAAVSSYPSKFQRTACCCYFMERRKSSLCNQQGGQQGVL